MPRLPLRILPLLLLALLVPLLAGCGGDDDHYYNDYPRYKDLTLILRVQSPGGNPIGGATVYVDGEPDVNTTDAEFHPLGEGYPTAWQGWLANWVSDAYQVVMNFAGDEDEFEIRVEKSGWVGDSTIVRISDEEPSHIFIRDIMVLRRPTDLGAIRAKHYAEVLAAPAGLKLNAAPAQRKPIAATDDRSK